MFKSHTIHAWNENTSRMSVSYMRKIKTLTSFKEMKLIAHQKLWIIMEIWVVFDVWWQKIDELKQFLENFEFGLINISVILINNFNERYDTITLNLWCKSFTTKIEWKEIIVMAISNKIILLTVIRL